VIAEAETVPAVERCAAVTEAVEDRPEVPNNAPAALSMPDAVMPATEMEPTVVSEDTVTVWEDESPAAVTEPETLTEEEVTAPDWMEPAETDAADTAPATVSDADCIKPVTDSALATKPPSAVAVVPVEPSRTDPLVGPSRRTPEVAPVPASRIRSPPTLAECPAA